MKNLFSSLKLATRRLWQAINPGAEGVRGAAAGMVALALLVYALSIGIATQGPLVVFLPLFLFFMLLGGLLLFFGQGIAALIGTLNKIPWTLRWSLAGGIALLFVANMTYNTPATLALTAFILVTGLLTGVGAWQLVRCRRELSPARRTAAIVSTALGVLLLAAGLAWYYSPGTPAAEISNAAAGGAPLEKVSLQDPSQPGPYAVKTLTYSPGTDRFRPEYGRNADVKSGTVDGSLLLNSSWKGLNGQVRSLAWGFGPQNLPLNGRVYYPDSAEGPFPLVLVVHGNHTDFDFSDAGYAYLGELLASRGFIFVSVDENFLNGGMVNWPGSMANENDARGWLLLEHLRQWHAWNDDPASPFYGKVDTQNIAVMGHSRGGEAAALAAVFNRLPYYPDNARLSFGYNFNIRAVAAIAPADGQYRPTGRLVPLQDVSYFVLHGSHDADASSFEGLRVYERTLFSGDSGFKAALYIYRANHGQFNQTWGDKDRGVWRGVLNRAALLPVEEQQQVAKVYLSAFLEASLRGAGGYLPLFVDYRAAGDGWLPENVYLNRFNRPGDRLIAGFEEDVDLMTAALPGAGIQVENLDLWREQRLPSKYGSGPETSAVLLGWNEDSTASYSITVPEGTFPPGASLIFNLADANQDPWPAEGFTGSKGPRGPLDLTVVLEDAAGQRAAVPLSDYRAVQPQIEAQIWKSSLFERQPRSEPVMQSFVFPLDKFTTANPALDLNRVTAIHFTFDRTPRGSLWLDGVGWRTE